MALNTVPLDFVEKPDEMGVSLVKRHETANKLADFKKKVGGKHQLDQGHAVGRTLDLLSTQDAIVANEGLC